MRNSVRYIMITEARNAWKIPAIISLFFKFLFTIAMIQLIIPKTRVTMPGILFVIQGFPNMR